MSWELCQCKTLATGRSDSCRHLPKVGLQRGFTQRCMVQGWRQWSNVVVKEILTGYKHCFREGGQVLKQIAPKCCGVSIPEDIQDFSWCGPEQPAVPGPPVSKRLEWMTPRSLTWPTFCHVPTKPRPLHSLGQSPRNAARNIHLLGIHIQQVSPEEKSINHFPKKKKKQEVQFFLKLRAVALPLPKSCAVPCWLSLVPSLTWEVQTRILQQLRNKDYFKRLRYTKEPGSVAKG